MTIIEPALDEATARYLNWYLEDPDRDWRSVDWTSTISEYGPHVIAALALHEQEFGFDWEDVDLLREAADIFGQHSDNLREHYNSISDRIAALLPPRDDDE